jgi:hypothetical protein
MKYVLTDARFNGHARRQRAAARGKKGFLETLALNHLLFF